MRRDIQVLRGVAVLLVVIFHADLGIAKHGYLGVDVFFVVSGFLITTIILRDLNLKKFSFASFYLRRAKRLLPALYCTLAFTSILSYGFLTSTQWNDFIAQLFGAVTFSANLILPTQVGYFESVADGKPLLHTWSLSLEEQYYFFLPLFLFLIPKNWRLWALVIATVGSLGWCLAWASSSDISAPFLWRFGDTSISEWAFYLFPTRAWELLAGSICAWVMLNKPITNVPPAIKVTSLMVIFLVCFIGLDSVHPRGDALIVVIATSIIILGRDNWLPDFKVLHWVERVGDWSYSIYLVHWPLFAFAYLGYVGQIPESSTIVLIFISVLLGYLQYRFVEIPFRYGWKSQGRSTWGWFVVATAAVFIIPSPMVFGLDDSKTALSRSIEEARKINYGLSAECNRWASSSSLNGECATGVNPTIAVWGDSYAMHLIPGVIESKKNLVQLTKSVCGPIVGIAPVRGPYTKSWAEKCIEHNDNALEFILKSDSITHVIMSANLRTYVEGLDGQFLFNNDLITGGRKLTIESLVSTINKIKSAGKKPILVSPLPRAGFNVGDCLERKDTNLIVLRKNCDIPLDDYLQYADKVIQSLETIEDRTGARVVWLKDLLCNHESCKSKLNETYVYRDEGHISISGSKVLFGKLSLTKEN
ncbi:MAG: acyltransferase family protein [Marinobacter sp.]